jgi:hypothetical protein
MGLIGELSLMEIRGIIRIGELLVGEGVKEFVGSYWRMENYLRLPAHTHPSARARH